jgi:hypothetical protein
MDISVITIRLKSDIRLTDMPLCRTEKYGSENKNNACPFSADTYRLGADIDKHPKSTDESEKDTKEIKTISYGNIFFS